MNTAVEKLAHTCKGHETLRKRMYIRMYVVMCVHLGVTFPIDSWFYILAAVDYYRPRPYMMNTDVIIDLYK